MHSLQETSNLYNISSDIKVDFIVEIIPQDPGSGSMPELVPVGVPEYVLALVATGTLLYLTGGLAAPATGPIVQAILSFFAALGFA